MNADQNAEVLVRLAAGRPVEGLGLGEKNGRINLNGLAVAEPVVSKPQRLAIAEVALIQEQVVIRGATWKSLDFSGSRLNGLRFFDCSIIDCIFDECQCRDWRFWGTTFESCSFKGVDFREAALGGVIERKRNTFRKVDFTGADLRQTAFVAAEFVSCLFRDSKLTKVNFGGSSFSDCIFEGQLREVCFNRTAFGNESLPPNEMSRVDFSGALLRLVEFRGLDMDSVRFPNNKDHIIVDDYRATLDRLLRTLHSRTDVGSKKLAAVLAISRKWAGSKQRRGVLNRNDLIALAGQELTAELLRLVGV